MDPVTVRFSTLATPLLRLPDTICKSTPAKARSKPRRVYCVGACVQPLAYLSFFLATGMSHRCTVLSPAEASDLPSGLYVTEITDFVCRVACFLPIRTSHSLIVPSALPEASVLPSGLYVTENTTFVCPWTVAASLG